MSGKATGWVLQNFLINGQGDRNRKLVLLSVADAANQYGETARVAVQVVCEEWGFDGGTVRRHLRDLVAEGWLEIEQESRGRGGPKVYSLPRMAAAITAQSARQYEDAPEAISAQFSEKVRANTAVDTSISITNGSNGTREEDPLLLAFSLWWKEYPRREDKRRALKCYRGRRNAEVSEEDLLAAVRQYAAEKDGEDLRWIKLPATFLAGEEGPWSEALERARREPEYDSRDLTAIQERLNAEKARRDAMTDEEREAAQRADPRSAWMFEDEEADE